MRAPTLGPLPGTLSPPASSGWQHTALCVHRLPQGHRTFTLWAKAKMRLSPWMPPNKHTHQAVRDASVSAAITTRAACTGWQEGSAEREPAVPAQPPLGATLDNPTAHLMDHDLCSAFWSLALCTGCVASPKLPQFTQSSAASFQQELC